MTGPAMPRDPTPIPNAKRLTRLTLMPMSAAVSRSDAAARMRRPSSVNCSSQYRASVIATETTHAISFGMLTITSPNSIFE